MPGGKANKGFTLIELIIVTMIISILAAALIPFSLKAVNKSRLESAAEMIAADIRYGGSKALSEQAELKIQFVPTGNKYLTFFDPENFNKCKTVKLPPGITLSSAMFSNEPFVRFSVKGTVKQGGTVSLHDPEKNWLFVIVTPVTGRVKIAKTIN